MELFWRLSGIRKDQDAEGRRLPGRNSSLGKHRQAVFPRGDARADDQPPPPHISAQKIALVNRLEIHRELVRTAHKGQILNVVGLVGQFPVDCGDCSRQHLDEVGRFPKMHQQAIHHGQARRSRRRRPRFYLPGRANDLPALNPSSLPSSTRLSPPPAVAATSFFYHKNKRIARGLCLCYPRATL